MNVMNKFYLLNIYLIFLFKLCSCQEIVYNNEIKETTKKSIQTTRIFYNTKTIPSITTIGYFTTTRNSIVTPYISNIGSNSSNYSNNTYELNNSTEVINEEEVSTNTTETTEYTNSTNLIDEEFTKNANWTSGFGTHYGPFPSNPHFSEIGYQPNDVGVGCSDGRPGGDPQWKNILSKGVYPAPNIINHEKTVWPVAYTVAVSAAVWNKEDVCWKTIKIRNKNKPENVIEAYIVDFCPIGYCQWKDKYLARNVDIYGEKAWLALGADVNESNLDIEIEWPKGAVPHDAIKLPNFGCSKINKSLIAIFIPLFLTIINNFAF